MKKEMKVAVITGASRGIGKAVAIGLANEGYQVCLLSRSKEKLQEVKNEISSDLMPLIYECDVADADAVHQTVETIIGELGSIDVLFNNAGILHEGSLIDVKNFNEMIQVNLIGAFNALNAVVPHMKKREQGYIFNLASICGKVGYANLGAYTASKFGLVGLSESLFHELVAHKVKITTICPAFVATDMVAHYEYPPANLMIQPEDIFKIIKGLLSLSSEACVQEVVVQCRSVVG